MLQTNTDAQLAAQRYKRKPPLSPPPSAKPSTELGGKDALPPHISNLSPPQSGASVRSVLPSSAHQSSISLPPFVPSVRSVHPQ
jgi:hypothetical protein